MLRRRSRRRAAESRTAAFGGRGRVLSTPLRKLGELVRRLGRVAALDEAEEVGMLGEIRLELSKTRTRPILEPRLGDVVLDAMEAAFAHYGRMIDT